MNQMFNQQDVSNEAWYIKVPNTGIVIENVPGLLTSQVNKFEHRIPGEWFYLEGEIYEIVMRYVVNLISFKMEKFKETKDIIKRVDVHIKQIALFTQGLATKILFDIATAHVNLIFNLEFMNVIPNSLLDTYAIIIDETTRELPPNRMYLGEFFTIALREVRETVNSYNELFVNKATLN